MFDPSAFSFISFRKSYDGIVKIVESDAMVTNLPKILLLFYIEKQISQFSTFGETILEEFYSLHSISLDQVHYIKIRNLRRKKSISNESETEFEIPFLKLALLLLIH